MRRVPIASPSSLPQDVIVSRVTRWLIVFALLATTLFGIANVAQRPVATYSIVAYDPNTGDLGVAVQSKFFGVGAVVPFAKAGVGAIATQSYANTLYGPQGLEMLSRGFSAEGAVHELTKNDKGRDVRQVGIVDARGQPAAFTGKECNSWAGHIIGDFYTVQGNILAGEIVVKRMEEAYLNARDTPGTELADWLLAAMLAGEAAGGDRRGRQSAAMLVARHKGGYAGQDDRYIDLRVDDNPQPLEELARLFDIHKQFYRAEHARRPKPGPLAADQVEPLENDFERLGWPFFLAAFVVIGFIFVFSAKNPPAPILGIVDGRLTPCPRRMNCVSSVALESEFRIEPLVFAGPMDEAKTLLMETTLKLPRTKLIEETGDYFRFECRSPVLGFVDDLELHFNEKDGRIHVRSGARCGYWDFRVNRRRVESLRAMLPASYTDLPVPKDAVVIPPAEEPEPGKKPESDKKDPSPEEKKSAKNE